MTLQEESKLERGALLPTGFKSIGILQTKQKELVDLVLNHFVPRIQLVLGLGLLYLQLTSRSDFKQIKTFVSHVDVLFMVLKLFEATATRNSL